MHVYIYIHTCIYIYIISIILAIKRGGLCQLITLACHRSLSHLFRWEATRPIGADGDFECKRPAMEIDSGSWGQLGGSLLFHEHLWSGHDHIRHLPETSWNLVAERCQVRWICRRGTGHRRRKERHHQILRILQMKIPKNEARPINKSTIGSLRILIFLYA